jgi:hypothetical protein
MKAKTAKALTELGRAAARHVGIPDDVVITMEILPDRDYEWCDLCDPNFAQVTEENSRMSDELNGIRYTKISLIDDYDDDNYGDFAALARRFCEDHVGHD